MAQKKTAKTAAPAVSEDERAAMKERADEVRKAKRRGASKADGEADVLAQIAEMPDADRVMAERLLALVKKAAPELTPRTWYGMPAYSNSDGVVCFFQAASKFKARYATLGFSDRAQLDDGAMWPSAFALTKLGPAEKKRITELIERAVGTGA